MCLYIKVHLFSFALFLFWLRPQESHQRKTETPGNSHDHKTRATQLIDGTYKTGVLVSQCCWSVPTCLQIQVSGSQHHQDTKMSLDLFVFKLTMSRTTSCRSVTWFKNTFFRNFHFLTCSKTGQWGTCHSHSDNFLKTKQQNNPGDL